MKRLFISDLHLHTFSYGATINDQGYNSRLVGQAGALREVLDYIEEHNIKYLYFNGDCFHVHGRIPVQALNVAVRFFQGARKRGCEIRGIYGNHDMESKDGKINSVEPILTADELWGNWEDSGLKVLALPYTENEETIKRFLGEAPQGAMLMLHQGVSGVPLTSAYVLNEILTYEMIPNYCTAFTGHYHTHRRVAPNLTVLGSLTPINWSDLDDPKGFLVWDDETQQYERILQKSAPQFTTNLMEVENAFVRFGDPIPMKDQEKVRADLIKEGALTVEFTRLDSIKESKEIRRGEAVTVEHLVKSFEADDMDPRRKQIGVEIRENRYEAPVSME